MDTQLFGIYGYELLFKRISEWIFGVRQEKKKG